MWEKTIWSVGAGKFFHAKVRRKVSLRMQSPEFADNTAPRWNIGANLLMPAWQRGMLRVGIQLSHTHTHARARRSGCEGAALNRARVFTMRFQFKARRLGPVFRSLRAHRKLIRGFSYNKERLDLYASKRKASLCGAKASFRHIKRRPGAM